MKVLHVINSLGIGGAETLLTNYLLAVSNEKEMSNEICILYGEKTFLYKKLEECGVTMHFLNSKRKFSIGILSKLLCLIRKNHYDIVHVHLFPALYYCALASIFNRKTVFVYTEHSISNKRRKHKLIQFLDYAAYKTYRKILCVSNAVRDSLVCWMESAERKSCVVYNGIPIEAAQGLDVQYDAILIGSMNSNDKGVDIFLKSLEVIRDDVEKVIIVGDGSKRGELAVLADKLGLSGKVEFVGIRNDVNRLLEQSRIFILPSRREGLPNSLLEAMAKARPMIASSVGGIPEVINHGRNGILVEPNDEEDLVNAMLTLLSDRQLSMRMGMAAYEEVCARFSIMAYIKRLFYEYRLLVKERRDLE